MKKAFLPIEKVKQLQDSIGFLNDYKETPDEIDHIGPNINTEDVKQTELLRELGKINARRDEIIKALIS